MIPLGELWGNIGGPGIHVLVLDKNVVEILAYFVLVHVFSFILLQVEISADG